MYKKDIQTFHYMNLNIVIPAGIFCLKKYVTLGDLLNGRTF